MIDKVFITEKLENLFSKTNPDSLIKVIVISFLYDKVNYLETIVGHTNSLKMLDKYIYNLYKNVMCFKELEKYHSIYAEYDIKTKSLKYYMAKDYNMINIRNMSNSKKKSLIIKEFKIMIYKALEVIINIYSLKGKIISNGFYIEDNHFRYPDYEGDFSNIIDIFAEDEVCKITNLNEKVKKYIDDEKKYFVLSKHISKRNSEVINYVSLWRKFIDSKLYYFAVNNPSKYTAKMIDNFNEEYNFVLENRKYKFLLKNKDIFSLIENYLIHIRERIDIDNNIIYHQDLSVIFKMMSKKRIINSFSDYVLHSTSPENKLLFEEIEGI